MINQLKTTIRRIGDLFPSLSPKYEPSDLKLVQKHFGYSACAHCFYDPEIHLCACPVVKRIGFLQLEKLCADCENFEFNRHHVEAAKILEENQHIYPYPPRPTKHLKLDTDGSATIQRLLRRRNITQEEKPNG